MCAVSEVRVYSEKLGPIADAQFERALARFDLGHFIRAEPTTSGLFGQNVFVSSSAGEFVLRGSPHWEDQFPKEKFFVDQLHAHTDVPVPWPYLHEPGTDIFGWGYVLMPRLIGEPAGADRPHRDKLQVAESMGDILARAQSLHFSAAGEYDVATNAIHPYPNGYAHWLTGWVDQSVADCMRDGCMAEAEKEWIAGISATAQPALAEPFQPTFVQNDFADGNMVVQKQNGAWRVSGLFDLAESRSGDGESDLVRQTGAFLSDLSAPRRELASAFVRAYHHRRPLRKGAAERFALHSVRNLLIVWHYGHSQAKWFAPELTFRQWAEPYVHCLPDLISCSEPGAQATVSPHFTLRR
jgi:hygromycin-B 7''-O-kinase